MFFQSTPFLDVSNFNNRYWLETGHFFGNNISNVPPENSHNDTESQIRLSRFER